MTIPNITPLTGLAHFLVLDGHLQANVALEAVEQAKEKNQPFAKILTDRHILPASTIAEVASKHFGIPWFNLEALDRSQMPLDLIDEDFINQHQILPIKKRGKRLFIAITDPGQEQLFNDLSFKTNLAITCVVANVDALNQIISDTLRQHRSKTLESYLEHADEHFHMDITTDEQEVSEDDNIDDVPIVRFVQKILLDAIQQHASDIHFESYEQSFRIRFRIDGFLYEKAAPPVHLASRITSRIKILANLDISERRIPQDGRCKLNVTNNRRIEFRISTCPTVSGEKVVMRILDPLSAEIGIDKLGFEESQKELFHSAITQPQGMILVTGPTGSGKTVTLYTALNLLNQPEKNITTVEDPVEIKINGINQVNIHPKAGLYFTNVLRAFLRQDPDIIMIGEMRDLETAEIAIKAAQTGHLVLSTLHTNGSIASITRLINMGVEPFNIAETVQLIIAQRLVRRLCDHCKISDQLARYQSIPELMDAENIFQANAEGCKHCTNGYNGRIGLYEMLHLNEEIAAMINKRSLITDIQKAALQQGFVPLRQAGYQRIRLGITSLAEVYRVTKD